MSDQTTTLRVTGMDCASCATTVQTGVERLTGVTACELNFTTETLRVTGPVSAETIAARVRELGYDVASADTSGDPPAAERNFIRYVWERRDTRLALFAMLLVLPGLLFHELLPVFGVEHPLIDIMSVSAMALAGYSVAGSAWRALRINHAITINLLMTIAAVGAVIIGAYTEAAVVMVLFVIGEALEGYSAEKARYSIRSLMSVAPQEATVMRPCIDCASHFGRDGYDGGPCPFCGIEAQRVPIDDLQIGETIIVKPGERIAMDGIILSGTTVVNQAPITGESLPVAKTVDDGVFAGSINGDGVLEIEVTHLAGDNTISRVIKLVEEAHERRAPTQRFIDRFARVYTPAVVVLALLVATIPPLVFGQPFLNPDATTTGWLYRALALLVVACPCALVISTPVSLVSAISNGARNGVLFKGGAAIEILAKIQAIALDKTGTLTRGRPAVTQVSAVDCLEIDTASCAACDDVLALASAVEQHSEHPLAHAIISEATARGVDHTYPAAASVAALSGRGITGEINGRTVTIGSHAYFDERVPHNAFCADVAAVDAQGYTTMLISEDETYRGYIAVADEVRESSNAAIAELKQMGIGRIVMLTGDNEKTAQRVGDQVGVTAIHANCLPEDKVTAIEKLRNEVGTVAMVGDGINDTPALATASVGIAIGTTAQAMESADVVLMRDSLLPLPFAVQLSRAAMRTISFNVAFSLGIKFVFLLLVLAGFGTMWMAVIADVGASLLVTLNGMRLLRHPRLRLRDELERDDLPVLTG
ncbi:MAG: cation-translocating P-type ATPase [Anaerolineae bacterium]|nr:cation-translocating P-type ATPase [Anaerolineae bacterium]